MESGLQPLLHPNYHHQITYAKFKLKICYPPPYGWLVYQCRKINIDAIRKSVHNFEQERHLINMSGNEEVSLFSQMIKNIIFNLSHMKSEFLMIETQPQ